MKSIMPVDEQLEFTLQTNIQEGLREIRRLKRASKKTIKHALYSLRLSSVQDASKKVADVLAVYDNSVREIILATSKVYKSVIQLGYTVNLDAFDKEDIEERYYSDGYLQCFVDIYTKFKELSGQL